MNSSVLNNLRVENLCSYFILPLLGLNRFSFGQANFVNSFLSTDHRYIVVQVADIQFCPGVQSHTAFYKWYIEAHETSMEYLVFEIPVCWDADLKKFCEGKYSQMSDEAKQIIISSSGLGWEQQMETGEIISDARLMALYRKEGLRKYWEHELGVTSLDNKDELLPVPPRSSFIEIL